MIINVESKLHCEELIKRILQTMSGAGYNVSRIQKRPRAFHEDDMYVFEGLSRAILTRQANWASVEKILPALKIDLFNYDLGKVAALTDEDIKKIYGKYRNIVRARFLEDELISIRENAKVFQKIRADGSVWRFIKSYLDEKHYDDSTKCYVWPQDDSLIERFTDHKSDLKLSGVGLAICCEFFNNIGIDEFKPDVHTKSFLNRINLDRNKTKVSTKDSDARKVGLTIAETLQKPRKFVDSHIWCFCAEGEAEICTEDNPKCGSCHLKMTNPQFCPGFPNRIQIIRTPVATAERFKECSLTKKEAYKKMKAAGLPQAKIDQILNKVYGPGKTPRVKWGEIETYIKADPCGSTQMMKQSGLSRADTYRYMKKAGLAPDEIDRILSKVYTDSEQ